MNLLTQLKGAVRDEATAEHDKAQAKNTMADDIEKLAKDLAQKLEEINNSDLTDEEKLEAYKALMNDADSERILSLAVQMVDNESLKAQLRELETQGNETPQEQAAEMDIAFVDTSDESDMGLPDNFAIDFSPGLG